MRSCCCAYLQGPSFEQEYGAYLSVLHSKYNGAGWPDNPVCYFAGAYAGVPLYSVDSSSGPPAGHLTLPVVPLSAADDQALFELNVRLQYSDDERLLLPALLELTGAVGVDMPAEALLSRPSILVRDTSA